MLCYNFTFGAKGSLDTGTKRDFQSWQDGQELIGVDNLHLTTGCVYIPTGICKVTNHEQVLIRGEEVDLSIGRIVVVNVEFCSCCQYHASGSYLQLLAGVNVLTTVDALAVVACNVHKGFFVTVGAGHQFVAHLGDDAFPLLLNHAGCGILQLLFAELLNKSLLQQRREQWPALDDVLVNTTDRKVRLVVRIVNEQCLAAIELLLELLQFLPPFL